MKWYGGKFYLAKRIIAQFPEHHIYLEPFGGAASVLLNKQPSNVEIYNDLDLRISRLFRVLRDQGTAFQEQLQLTPYSQVEFNLAADYPKRATDVHKAVCDFVRFRQSFGGRGESWSYTRRSQISIAIGMLSIAEENFMWSFESKTFTRSRVD